MNEPLPTAERLSPITYYGGKSRMLRHILPIIPEHHIYCEPFAGGLAVFFGKKPSRVEIVNDVNRFVTAFYKQAQSNFDALQARIRETLHARSAYDDAMLIYKNPTHFAFTDLDRAWAFWVGTNMGFACHIGSWGYGTADNKRENSLANKRENFTEVLTKRLEHTQIECRDALLVIKARDRENTFHYIDPPYFNSNMGHYGGYTEQDFRNLLEVCGNLKGKFLLSSYPSDALAEAVAQNGWYQKEFKMAISASKYRKPKTEVLTANYPI